MTKKVTQEMIEAERSECLRRESIRTRVNTLRFCKARTSTNNIIFMAHGQGRPMRQAIAVARYENGGMIRVP